MEKTYLYLLYTEIYYNSICKEYYNILTINKEPEGELKNYTKLISIIGRQTIDNHCTFAISNTLLNNNYNYNYNYNYNNSSNKYYKNYNNLLTLDELNELTEFLINNNYIIDYSITKIYKNSTNKFKKNLIYSFKITL